MATATSSSPLAQTIFAPYRRTRTALRGAQSSWPTASGMVSKPACSGL